MSWLAVQFGASNVLGG